MRSRNSLNELTEKKDALFSDRDSALSGKPAVSEFAWSEEDQVFMRRALQLAQKAADQGEVPVGAIVVMNDQIIGEGWNAPIAGHNPCAHAEIKALQQAGQHQQNYRLPGATVYVTLEPCAMCAGALIWARVSRVVWGAADPKSGAAGSVVNLFAEAKLNHHAVQQGGLCAEESAALLRQFFSNKRKGSHQEPSQAFQDDAISRLNRNPDLKDGEQIDGKQRDGKQRDGNRSPFNELNKADHEGLTR
jgi:tRNA(adenine34) deaminase